MQPDDERHGTTRGFHAGCRELCCRRAISRYEKGAKYRRAKGIAWAIPALGAQRRIQALLALGWTSTDIAEACGWRHRNSVFRILKGQNGRPCTWIERKTYHSISEVYERLCMTLPEHTPQHARTRSLAQKKGYLPPLCWDDIDTDARPQGHGWTPVKKRTRAEMSAELEHLRGLGVSDFQAAKQLGVSLDALEKADERAKEGAA